MITLLILLKDFEILYPVQTYIIFHKLAIDFMVLVGSY
jgi:hypothetical protein